MGLVISICGLIDLRNIARLWLLPFYYHYVVCIFKHCTSFAFFSNIWHNKYTNTASTRWNNSALLPRTIKIFLVIVTELAFLELHSSYQNANNSSICQFLLITSTQRLVHQQTTSKWMHSSKTVTNVWSQVLNLSHFKSYSRHFKSCSSHFKLCSSHLKSFSSQFKSCSSQEDSPRDMPVFLSQTTLAAVVLVYREAKCWNRVSSSTAGSRSPTQTEYSEVLSLGEPTVFNLNLEDSNVNAFQYLLSYICVYSAVHSPVTYQICSNYEMF